MMRKAHGAQNSMSMWSSLLFHRIILLLLCLQLLLLSSPSSRTAVLVQAKASDAKYRWFCDLSLNTVVTLEWNEELQNYVAPSIAEEEEEEDDDDSSNNNSSSPTTSNNWNFRQRQRFLWEPMLVEADDGEHEDEQQQQQLFLRSNSRPGSTHHHNDIPEFMYFYSEPAIEARQSHQSQQKRQLAFVTGNNIQQETRDSNSPVIVVDGEPRQGGGASPTSSSSSSSSRPLTVEARSCDCWNSMVWGGEFYCAVPRTHCAIPNSPSGLPGCVDVRKERRIVRSIWPVLVVWYASVLFCLSFTTTGRHAMSCCISVVYPSWNRDTADRILQNDPNQANQMLLRHYRTMRRNWELRQRRRDRQRRRSREHNNAGPEPPPANDPLPSLWDLAIIPRTLVNAGEPMPTALQLKTRIYKHEDEHHFGNSDDNDDDGNDDDEPGNENEINSAVEDTNKKNNAETDIEDPEKLTGLTEGGTILTPHNVTADTISLDSDDAGDNPDADDCGDHEDNDILMTAADDNASLNEWDDRTCTICYAPLEDGDRVGALSCGHVFHVDPCLKHWLARRNVCPLCLQEDVATPQYDPQQQQQQQHRMHHTNNMSPIVLGPPAASAAGDSSSDVDRSSSRDDSSTNGASGGNPNEVPAFQHSGITASTYRRNVTGRNSANNNNSGNGNSSEGRGIEMTSFFSRLRNRNARHRTGDQNGTTPNADANTTNTHGGGDNLGSEEAETREIQTSPS